MGISSVTCGPSRIIEHFAFFYSAILFHCPVFTNYLINSTYYYSVIHSDKGLKLLCANSVLPSL